MPLVAGTAVSYSPLLYRPREQWGAIARHLVGDVVQPNRRSDEDADLLAAYERRIAAAFDRLTGVIDASELDALVVLYADRGDIFDDSNTPQIHVQIGGDLWGDDTIPELGESRQPTTFKSDAVIGETVAEELTRHGLDISEGRDLFAPLGAGGLGPAVTSAVKRLGGGLPIVPIHVNCHVEPMITGARLYALGRALAAATAHVADRVGLVATGGLSGDPGGPMAGWIDDVLDEWVLTRIERAQAADLAPMWQARSRTLQGNSAAIRLWGVAAAAFETVGTPSRVVDYLPVHHAATGVGFVAWTGPSCR